MPGVGRGGTCRATKKICLLYHTFFLNDVPERQIRHLLPKLLGCISREKRVWLMMQSSFDCSPGNNRGHNLWKVKAV